MSDETLLNELERALTDEAYDGGMGALNEREFKDLVRTLAVTAAAVFEKAHTPTDDERETLRAALRQKVGVYYSYEEHEEVMDVVFALGFRRSVVPEPTSEVIGEWFTSSHGVAVAAIAPMTDRGPSVMVDGLVISPNDVAALVEFKAQDEPSMPPEVDADPDIAFDLGRVAGYDEAMREKTTGPTPLRIYASGKGKTQAMIDALLAQANDRGVRVEVVYPQSHLIGHVELLIDDLKSTRKDGTVLTTGYLIHRLNAALSAVTEQGENRQEQNCDE